MDYEKPRNLGGYIPIVGITGITYESVSYFQVDHL